MLIVGEWHLFDDGVTRLLVQAQVLGEGGVAFAQDFLIDTGADRTVFSAVLLERLQLPAQHAESGSSLSGIGGQSPFVLATTIMEFLCDDGRLIRVRGEFASFTDPAATDLSVLGRDVLDNFDLIFSRRRDEIFLLAPRHRYRIDQN